jgi:hypothetical protein
MKTGLVAPFVLTGTVHVRVGDAVHPVEIQFPPGQPITERDILVQIGKALAKVRRDVDRSAELFTAHEFFNGVLIAEHFGQPGAFELPESFDYDHEAVTAAALVQHAASSMPAVDTIQ